MNAGNLAAMKRLLVVFTLVLIVALAGCGGGSSGSNQFGGPPGAGFTNASFSGAYAFKITATNAGGFFTIAGTLQANGNGAITSGTMDINSPGTTGVQTNVSVSGGYTVMSDGRGSVSLLSSVGAVNFSLVMLSAQRALVIRLDAGESASGSLDLQTTSAFSLTAVAGNFAFNFDGVDGPVQHPEVSAGVFTVDTAGDITAGVQDTNHNGVLSTNAPMTIGPLAMSAPVNGRGTLALTTLADGTRHFIYYVISANQIRLLGTDSAPVLSGDAFRQTSTTVSGSFAFTLSGTSTGGPFVAGGIINTDGAGNVLVTSVEDTNNGGVVVQSTAVSGPYAVAVTGRGTMTLNGTIHFAIYPSSAGLQMVQIDTTTIAGGTAFQQSGTFSNSTVNGRYGMNNTGIALNGPPTQFDDVAQFTADGAGNYTGNLDVNRIGLPHLGLAMTGTYALSANGRGAGTLTGVFNPRQNLMYYAASGTHVLFIEIDLLGATVGDIEQQQ